MVTVAGHKLLVREDMFLTSSSADSLLTIQYVLICTANSSESDGDSTSEENLDTVIPTRPNVDGQFDG